LCPGSPAITQGSAGRRSGTDEEAAEPDQVDRFEPRAGPVAGRFLPAIGESSSPLFAIDVERKVLLVDFGIFAVGTDGADRVVQLLLQLVFSLAKRNGDLVVAADGFALEFATSSG